ncbi:MAG: hypothetical protein IT306_24805 [Chloroflexi bacterium]|nr:hypothetical protein [Chloroflexota bacterium]
MASMALLFTSTTLETADRLRDIVPIKPTLEEARTASAAPAADVAPAGGFDILIVGLIAAVVAIVLVVTIRARRKR